MFKDSEIVREPIFSMTTIGTFSHPSARVMVNPDDGRIGDPYFKVCNNESLQAADKISRISFLEPKTFDTHTDTSGKQVWTLNSHDKRALCNFLDRVHRDYRKYQFTNWEIALYNWNKEHHFLDDDFPENYDNSAQAYLNHYYDTEENLNNASYLKPDLIRPNYLEI